MGWRTRARAGLREALSLRISLRAWMVLVAVVGILTGFHYHREFLTPENVKRLAPVGGLAKDDIWRITWTLFETATGERLVVLPKRMTHEIQFHPRGHTLAATYFDGSVALWRVPDGGLHHERKTRAEELYTVDWSPDGALLATAGRNANITLWDPRDLSVIRELAAPEWVVRVKFSPDGLHLHYAGGTAASGGKRRLEVLGIEGSLYSLLNRPGRSVWGAAWVFGPTGGGLRARDYRARGDRRCTTLRRPGPRTGVRP